MHDLEHCRAFVNAHIGRPHKRGAQGPDAYDCWSIFRLANRELFGREASVVAVDPADLSAVVGAFKNHKERNRWTPVVRPQHGDAVTLTHHQHEHHIGLFLALDRGGLFHSVDGLGCCFDRLVTLPMQGWMRLRFYRFVETPA